jgi:hypothetical protein
MERVFHRTTERYSTLARNTITTLVAIFSVHYIASCSSTTVYQHDLFRVGRITPRRAVAPPPSGNCLLQFTRAGIQTLQQFPASAGELQRRALRLVLPHFDKLIVAQRENVGITFFQMPSGVPEQHERREFVMTQHRTPPSINAWMVSTS